MKEENEIAVLGAGCFWCTEAVFEQLRGVVSVAPGYAGGTVENPSYEQVCTGSTGHAEVARIEFDPSIISYQKLLEVFFTTHDPTTLNRQGNDVGNQYRSVIFTTTQDQKQIAQEMINRLSGTYSKPIVTQIEPLTAVYPAEDYHEKYFEKHKDQPYCQIVIAPKVEKVQKNYKDLLK